MQVVSIDGPPAKGGGKGMFGGGKGKGGGGKGNVGGKGGVKRT